MLRYVEAWDRLRCAANFCFHAESIELSRVEVNKKKIIIKKLHDAITELKKKRIKKIPVSWAER